MEKQQKRRAELVKLRTELKDLKERIDNNRILVDDMLARGASVAQIDVVLRETIAMIERSRDIKDYITGNA